jgi:hypothetical protein
LWASGLIWDGYIKLHIGGGVGWLNYHHEEGHSGGDKGETADFAGIYFGNGNLHHHTHLPFYPETAT